MTTTTTYTGLITIKTLDGDIVFNDLGKIEARTTPKLPGYVGLTCFTSGFTPKSEFEGSDDRYNIICNPGEKETVFSEVLPVGRDITGAWLGHVG